MENIDFSKIDIARIPYPPPELQARIDAARAEDLRRADEYRARQQAEGTR